MSTIVKIRNPKTGIVYAYEQTARWDPEKGQSRPTRKYLGRYIEETGEIIQSTGKRGRPKVNKDPDLSSPDTSQAYLELKGRYDSLCRELASCKDDLSRYSAENTRLRKALMDASKLLASCSSELGRLTDELSDD